MEKEKRPADKDRSKELGKTARFRAIKDSDEDESVEIVEEPIKPKHVKMSSKYKKKYSILAAVVLLFFVGIYPFIRVKEIDFKAADKNIRTVLSPDDFNLDNDKKEVSLRRMYNIDQSEIEGYTLFTPKSNMYSSEIAIIKCKPEYKEKIYNSISARIASQKNSFKNYAVNQGIILDKSVLKRKGNYIIFISCKNVKEVEKEIKKSYK